MTATIETHTRSFAASLARVAELLESVPHLGGVNSVFATPRHASIEPAAETPLARVALVAKWAQHFNNQVRILVGVNSTTVKTDLTYHAVPITVDTHVYSTDAWELARRVLVSLDGDTATVAPTDLLAALEAGGPQ